MQTNTGHGGDVWGGKQGTVWRRKSVGAATRALESPPVLKGAFIFSHAILRTLAQRHEQAEASFMEPPK